MNAEIDRQLVSTGFLSDPYPVYQQLQNEALVYWSESWNAWLVTRYDDNLAIFRDPVHFGNAGRFDGLFEGLTPDVRRDVDRLEAHFTRSGGLIHADPPNHTRLRRLVHLAFAPRIIRQMQPLVELIVERCLDTVQARGRMDVIHDLAYPLPATIVARLLGVPEHCLTGCRIRGWRTPNWNGCQISCAD
ncbi:MAG: cytochrome P450 [Chloroflexi bacterium]|nr:cytochrome P450 [Chloroflexota bacterium]